MPKQDSHFPKKETTQADKILEKKKQHERFARAASEDDDGYDPWSDRPAENPVWEEDPWR